MSVAFLNRFLGPSILCLLLLGACASEESSKSDTQSDHGGTLIAGIFENNWNQPIRICYDRGKGESYEQFVMADVQPGRSTKGLGVDVDFFFHQGKWYKIQGYLGSGDFLNPARVDAAGNPHGFLCVVSGCMKDCGS